MKVSPVSKLLKTFISHKLFFSIIVLITAGAAKLNAQEKIPLHSLGLTPSNLINGSVGLNYEYLFHNSFGVLVEGSTGFNEKFDICTSLRYHFFEEDIDTSGINTPYFGIFIKTGRNSHNIKSDDKKYQFELEYLTAGINYGNKYKWGKYFTYGWRIGYGYPFKADFNWTDPKGKPDDYKSIQDIVRVFAGIDAELSIGINF